MGRMFGLNPGESRRPGLIGKLVTGAVVAAGAKPCKVCGRPMAAGKNSRKAEVHGKCGEIEARGAQYW